MAFFKKVKKDKIENNNNCDKNDDNLLLKSGDDSEPACCTGSGCVDEKTEIDSEDDYTGLIIKILGSGCKNCITLTENVKTAIQEMGLEAQIVKVTDFAEITGYGVMTTPALVVNEVVVSYGKVLKPNEVVKILNKVLGV